MEIKPYSQNAKKHPKKQIEQIANSIREFGMNQQIVVDKNGVIIVGHGRFEALKHLGWEVNDEWIRVVDLTEEQAKSYRLADNKLNESEWDMGLVIDELKGLSDEMLDLSGFDKDLITEPGEKDDEVPDVPEESTSKLGDMYILGNHRVLCGDSTKIEDVERLMDGKKADMVFTDPPYGVEYERHIPNAKFDQLKNDDVLLFEWMEHIDWSVPIYICTRWDVYSEWATMIKSYADIRNVIVWDKDAYGLGDLKTTFAPSHEFIIYATQSPYIFPSSERDRDVWTVKRAIDYKHPTQKPVEIPERAIKHTISHGVVLDLFLGSGSTLIAAEKTGRICYGMELDPKYVDVIVQRHCEYTGNYNIQKNGENIVWQKK